MDKTDIITAEEKSTSLDEKNVEPQVAVFEHHYVVSDVHALDVAVLLAAGHADDPDLTADETRRLLSKLDWFLLPLLCCIYTVQYVDKQSLASSAILGIIPDNNLSQNEFNNLSSAFYIGYLIFSYPQNWALQHFPVGKWITLNLFFWCLFLGLQAACHDDGSLFALRVLLGGAEGCITPGLVLITSMYYTQTEIGERIGWIFSCNGFAVIIGGFLSFAAFHVPPDAQPEPWKWYMIIIALVTTVVLLLFLLFFPDNTVNARFLTQQDKIAVVQRIRVNNTGIETKVWKKKQFMEALTDIKTWLFFLFAVFGDLSTGAGVQYAIIIKSFGFTTLQTTLLNIPSGSLQVIGIWMACFLLRKFPNSRAWIAFGSFIPSVLSTLLEIFLPFDNKLGHLIALYLQYFTSSNAFIMVLSWMASAISGHTKKTTVSGIFFVGYALGQMLSVQFWKAKYQPRDIVPWTIVLVVLVVSMVLVLAIRYFMVKENRRRDRLKLEAGANGGSLQDFEEYAYVELVGAEGRALKKKIQKAMLDMTDQENLSFRYVL